MSGAATLRTLEVLDAALRITGVLEMRLKMHFDFPRPITTSDELQPIIQTPGHGSWPSGHATESFVAAALLTALMSGVSERGPDAVVRQSQAMRLAARIATNRTVAGVHYPSDSMAGAVLGLGIAETIVSVMEGDATTPTFVFEGATFDKDFDLDTLKTVMSSGAGTAAVTTGPSALLKRLWKEAKAEWQ